VKADPEDQLRLLDLQEVDTALDRLANRRRTLPELEQIERLTARLGQVRDAIVQAETDASDIARQQTKAENDVEQVRNRTERDQRRLDAGQVSTPKELENLQSEIASLHRRQSGLEDIVLGIMEKREEAESRAASLVEERQRLSEELADLERKRDSEFAKIDEEASAKETEREAIGAHLPDDLRQLYEKLRTQMGGIGVAMLRRSRCEGCNLTLNTVDLNRIRSAAPEEVVRCEECRRILVRTAESGL
jgi:uncharacterized protein